MELVSKPCNSNYFNPFKNEHDITEHKIPSITDLEYMYVFIFAMNQLINQLDLYYLHG